MQLNTTWKKIVSFSLPMTLIGVFDLLLIFIDFFWIHLIIGDSNGLSAVRVSASIVMIIEALLIGVISALLVYISQHVGAGEMEKAKSGIRSSFAFAIYSGIAITIIGFLAISMLIKMFGVNVETELYIDDYLSVYLLGYIAMSLNKLLLFIPRYFQKVTLIYKGFAIAITVNIIATPVCMWLIGEAGGSQISGAAAGTILANAVCALYMIHRLFIKDELRVGFSKHEISLHLDISLLNKNRTYIGSQIFNGITFKLSVFLYILILSYYPSEAFNVYALASYVYIFFGLIAQNFAASLIPMVSQLKGAGKIDDILDLVRKVTYILIGYCSIVAGIIIVGRVAISNILTTDSSLTPIFSEFFLIYTVPWMLSIISIVFVFVVTGSGDAKGSLTLTIINMYLIAIICLLFVPSLFQNQITGVFITLALIQVLTFITSFTYYLFGRWKKVSLVKNQHTKEEKGAPA